MIPWELHHRLVVVDLDKKVLKKVVRKERIIIRKIWKLNENQTRVRFENRVKELVSTDPCGICGRRVMANSVLCKKYGNWVHGKCAKAKRATLDCQCILFS